jgi:hypothetical protein
MTGADLPPGEPSERLFPRQTRQGTGLGIGNRIGIGIGIGIGNRIGIGIGIGIGTGLGIGNRIGIGIGIGIRIRIGIRQPSDSRGQVGR